jgi:hypothetical protein
MKERRNEYCILSIEEERGLADITVKRRGQNILWKRGRQKKKTAVL